MKSYVKFETPTFCQTRSGFSRCPNDIEILTRVCERLIKNPTLEEGNILASLGRASFGLELALQAPRSQIFHNATLPARIYLDANVLMPAFIVGHTFHPVYKETIDALRRATKDGRQTFLCTTYGYLSEVVGHRNLAIQEYTAESDNFREHALRDAIFSGSTRINVFIGAYANMAAADETLTFPSFLQNYAPFQNERELQRWLEQREVMVISQRNVPKDTFSDVSFELQKGFARSLRSDKDMRLLEHDAVQIGALSEDIKRGVRSILVTADKRLREIVGDSKLKRLTGHMLSHVGLAQLIDLLIGQSSDGRSLAHLLWDTTISKKSDEIRTYFIGLALGHYDEAMAMELPGLVDIFSDKVALEAKRRGIDIGKYSGSNKQLFTIAGSFEDQFFEAISAKIKLRQNEMNTTG